jgi:hypothetical protein
MTCENNREPLKKKKAKGRNKKKTKKKREHCKNKKKQKPNIKTMSSCGSSSSAYQRQPWAQSWNAPQLQSFNALYPAQNQQWSQGWNGRSQAARNASYLGPNQWSTPAGRSVANVVIEDQKLANMLSSLGYSPFPPAPGVALLAPALSFSGNNHAAESCMGSTYSQEYMREPIFSIGQPRMSGDWQRPYNSPWSASSTWGLNRNNSLWRNASWGNSRA